MFYIYVIYNQDHNKIYIGQTDNLENRIKEHNDPNNKTHGFTKRFSGEWKLIYQEKVETRERAKVKKNSLRVIKADSTLKNLFLGSSVGRASAC